MHIEQNRIRNPNDLEKLKNRSDGLRLTWSLHLDKNNQSCSCQIEKIWLSTSAEEDDTSYGKLQTEQQVNDDVLF